MSAKDNPNYGKYPRVEKSNQYPGVPTSVVPILERQKQLRQLYEEKNQELANILITFIGVKYKRGGFSYDGIDCSGLLGKPLNMMGYKIGRNQVSTGILSSGKTDWIGIYPNINETKAGDLGMINFYKTEQSKTINHMNMGIGETNIPILFIDRINQIVDATEKDTMETHRNDGRVGQYFYAGTAQVNQTYAPFSSNTPPSLQSYIKWEVLEEKYKE